MKWMLNSYWAEKETKDDKRKPKHLSKVRFSKRNK